MRKNRTNETNTFIASYNHSHNTHNDQLHCNIFSVLFVFDLSEMKWIEINNDSKVKQNENGSEFWTKPILYYINECECIWTNKNVRDHFDLMEKKL